MGMARWVGAGVGGASSRRVCVLCDMLEGSQGRSAPPLQPPAAGACRWHRALHLPRMDATQSARVGYACEAARA